MRDLSLIERLGEIFEIVFSSPFFIMLLLIVVLTILIFSILSKLKDERPKIIAGLGYLCLIAYVFIAYGSYLLQAGNSFMDSFFSFLYFPNGISYICTMIIASILMIYSITRKKSKGIIKITNVAAVSLLQFFFVLVLDLLLENNINLFEKSDIYSNSSITVLIQASMAIVVVWFFALLVGFLINKLTYKLTNEQKIDKNINKEN